MPKNRESYFLPFKRESSCRRRCSPPPNAKAEKNPTSPVSRGAEAIPATRERRSRRAYHPRNGKMRADLPPAASGGQGVRHATGTPATTRTGEYGGRRGCRGARPSHPLPPAAQATTPGCRAEAASQRQEKSLVCRNRGNDFPPVRRESPCRRRCSPPRNAKAGKKHQPSELGRGGDPRAAGAPQQARISPAKREDARRLPHAASGGQGTRHATVTPSATRKRGSTGGVGGVEGLAPLTPCRQPRRLPHPDAGLKPQASGNKKRKKRKRPAQGHPSEGSSARRSTCPGCAACPAYRSSRVPCAAS